jgi:50S ribosomal subunit-associated GTPase HflX
VAQVELDTMQAQLSKVERNIEALEAEDEEQGARGRGDEAEVSTLREEKASSLKLHQQDQRHQCHQASL